MTLMDGVGGQACSPGQAFTSRAPVLVLMIEEWFALYLALALFRCMCGRATAGILFRPLQAVRSGSWRHWLKRLALRLLCHLPRVQTVSLVPAWVDPRIERIANDWIYDPQLWDWADVAVPDRNTLALRDHVLTKDERPVVVALGVQNQDKGIDFLAQCYQTDHAVQLVVAGLFAPAAKGVAADLRARGATVVDDFVSHDELVALYGFADAVWCAYDPGYDQASGILGRAVQKGRLVLVREGSASAKLCAKVGHPHLPLDVPQELGRVLACGVLTPRGAQAVAGAGVAHAGAASFRHRFDDMLQRLCPTTTPTGQG